MPKVARTVKKISEEELSYENCRSDFVAIFYFFPKHVEYPNYNVQHIH